MRSLYNIWVILQKEFVETFRDKAFIYTNFIGPLIFFPILFILWGEIYTVKNSNIEKEQYKVYVQGEIPKEINQKIENISKVTILKGNQSFDQKISKYVDKDNPIAQKKIFKIYSKNQFDVIIATKLDTQTQQTEIGILLDSTSSKASRARNIIYKLFKEYNVESYNQRLDDLNVLQTSLTPLTFKKMNIRPPGQTMGHFIGIAASFFIIFLLIIAIHHPAIHSTIGERDRNTLNFLLMSPLSTREILLGKFLNIAIQGLLALIPYAFQLVIAYYNFNQFFGDINLSIITPQNIIFAFMLILSISLFLASISFTLTCMAKTMAQAQTLMSFIIVLVFVPLGIIKGLELTTELKYAFIPIANFSLGLQDIFMNSHNYAFYALTFFCNLIYSVLLVMYADYFFKAQNILSKGDANFFDAVSFKKIKIAKCNPSISIILSMAIPFFIVNSNSFTFMKNNPLYLILFNTIFAHLMVTTMVLRFYRTELKASMSLYRPKGKYLMAGICFGIGSVPVSIYLTSFILGQGYHKSLFLSSMPNIESMPLWVGFIFVAIFPGVCEEIAYRGVILNGFKKRFPPFITILTTALLFSLAHFSLGRIMTSLFVGVLFGLLAMRSRSVYPAILGHVCFNSFILVLSKVKIFQTHQFSKFELIMIAISSLLFLALGIALISDEKRHKGLRSNLFTMNMPDKSLDKDDSKSA